MLLEKVALCALRIFKIKKKNPSFVKTDTFPSTLGNAFFCPTVGAENIYFHLSSLNRLFFSFSM